jgi:hypothetical protein
MKYEDVVSLVEDAEIFSIDPEDYIYLDEAITIGDKQYLTGKYAKAAYDSAVAGGKDAAKAVGGKIGDLAKAGADKIGNAKVSAVADKIASNPSMTGAVAIGVAAAVIAAAGAALLVKYFNSIGRLKKLSEVYAKKAAEAKTPEQKAKFTQKAQKYSQKLKLAQAKARVQKSKFIDDTKQMKERFAQMKKSGGDEKTLAKLSKKIEARNKVLAKIGAL